MNERWDWWNKETEEERLLKLLIAKVEVLGRLPTAQEVIDDPAMPNPYAYARYYGSIDQAFQKVASLLFDSTKKQSPTELSEEQRRLPQEEQDRLKQQLQVEYERRLQDLRDTKILRERMLGQQRTPELAKVTENVTVIPTQRHLRLSDYTKQKHYPVYIEQSEFTKAAPEAARVAVKRVAEEVVQTVVEQATVMISQTTIEPLKEGQDMSKKFTREDAIKTLKIYEEYGRIPTAQQLNDFARGYPERPGYPVIYRLLGGAKEWSAILATDGAETQDGSGEAAQGSTAEARPTPLAQDDVATESVEGLEVSAEVAESTEPKVIAMRLTGEVCAEVCVHGQPYKVQIQLGGDKAG